MTGPTSHRKISGSDSIAPLRTLQERLVFDRASIQGVDREAIERFGIPGVVLMENAARGCADQLLLRWPPRVGERPRRVLICCGTGNNGGDGYALARHLSNAGARPVLAVMGESRPGSDAAINDQICRRMEIPRFESIETAIPPAPDLVVDALFGTGLDRAVRGAAANWIRWINQQPAPVVAVDVPSGLDCNEGRALGDAVVADLTVTFVGEKVGFLNSDAAGHLGEVAIVDIGAPTALSRKYGRKDP